MKVKFYGARGSLPVCRREFERYGGNTTCIRLLREQANRVAIFDAGTGIRKLGKELMNEGLDQKLVNIAFSHFHWDHIQGFPFFAPAYKVGQRIGILAPGRKGKITDLKGIFSIPLQQEYFPVPLERMGASFEFYAYGEEETIYGAYLKSISQHHIYPGGSYGFRVHDEGKSLVICTDIEHIDGIDQKIVEFARNADLLIHDGQFTTEEYTKFKGWGHSSWEQAVEVAVQANVKKLIITHHDPDHNDDFLDSLEIQCQKLFPNSLFAKEELEVVV
ncbi:MAG TPA: MBL fold metallo-hydrolase [Puia sp.]|nr:MBL fold metallo-hydrolase [Puia sp.]